MIKNAAEHGGIRDSLARDRTSLANERTLLAYQRTAIMLLASGLTLIKLLGSDLYLLILGYGLVPLSMGVAVFGYLRFARMQRQIRADSGTTHETEEHQPERDRLKPAREASGGAKPT